MLLRCWLSSISFQLHQPRPRKRKRSQDRHQAAEVLEKKIALGDVGLTTLGTAALSNAAASNAATGTPTDDSNSEQDSSDEPLFAKTETAPPDDEQFPVTPTPDRRPATPLNRTDTPPQDVDVLGSIFADNGLESALLTNPPATSTPPHLEPLDLPELSQPRETDGGGGASGHNPSAGGGTVGGAAGARGGFIGADRTEGRAVNNFVNNPVPDTQNGEPAVGVEAEGQLGTTAASNGPSFVLHGGYVAAGTGLRGQTSGPISISGIPANSTVKAAYLYWGYLDDTESPSFKTLTLNGQSVTGALVGSGPDTCWGRQHSYAYRAQVTSAVTGNGTYSLSGVASEGQTLAQGASLVVVYENTNSPVSQILLYSGNDVIPHSSSFSQVFDGLQVVEPDGGQISAKTTFIVGDGQSYTESLAFTGSSGTMTQASPFGGSDGLYWDTGTYDVSNYISNDETSVSATMGGGTDCLMWVGQVISVSSSMLDLDVARAHCRTVFAVYVDSGR